MTAMHYLLFGIIAIFTCAAVYIGIGQPFSKAITSDPNLAVIQAFVSVILFIIGLLLPSPK